MEHIHSVYDTDKHFIINPATRVVTNECGKIVLIQGDHDSERFTFEMPRYIEGHDMALCNVVEVHYNNVDAKTSTESRDVYEVTDLQISPEDENKVICSWLISSNATKYVGVLGFVVKFACVTDGVVRYAWHTAVHSSVTVLVSINNSAAVATEFSDILEQWRDELFGSIYDGIGALEQAADEQIKRVQTATNEILESIPPEYTEVAEQARESAPAIIAESSGALVAIGDGAARPVVQLVSSMAAVQAGSGEASPENVRAITGWDAVKVWRTGKNLLNASQWTNKTTAGITFTNNGDGSVSVAGTNATGSPVNHQVAISLPLKAGTYTVSGCGTTAAGCYSVVTHRSNGAVAFAYGDKQLVIDTDQTVVCYIQVAAGATVDVTLWPMIEVGSFATAFEAYQGVTLNAALPETVYGGTLDWMTGVLMVTHALLTLTGDGFAQVADKPWFFRKGVADMEQGSVSTKRAVCSHFAGNVGVWSASGTGILTNTSYIWIAYPEAATVDDFHAFLTAQADAGTPVQVVYKIAEPYTVQLDAQTLDMLKGSNALWSDCGDTAVSYVADTKLYIDNKFAELTNAILAQGANI